MNTTTSVERCQAKDPSTCRFHGNATRLKQKMLLAESIYLQFENQLSPFHPAYDKAYQAYASYESAQVDYYATIEGEQVLLSLIAEAETISEKQRLGAILIDARKMRFDGEKQNAEESYNMWAEPQKPEATLSVSTKDRLAYLSRTPHLIPLHVTEHVQIVWNKERQSVLMYYEEGLTVRTLGLADSQGEAEQLTRKYLTALS